MREGGGDLTADNDARCEEDTRGDTLVLEEEDGERDVDELLAGEVLALAERLVRKDTLGEEDGVAPTAPPRS